jgi:hypothetical protein
MKDMYIDTQPHIRDIIRALCQIGAHTAPVML